MTGAQVLICGREREGVHCVVGVSTSLEPTLVGCPVDGADDDRRAAL